MFVSYEGWYYLFAELIGLAGFLISVISMQMKAGEGIIKLSALSNFVWVPHYFLFGAYTAAFMCIFAAVRLLASLAVKESDIKYIAYLSIGVFIIVGVETYDGLTSVFPVIGSILLTVSLIFKRHTWCLRLGSLLCVLFWLLHGVCIESQSAILSNLVLSISTIVGFLRHEEGIFLKRIEKPVSCA